MSPPRPTTAGPRIDVDFHEQREFAKAWNRALLRRLVRVLVKGEAASGHFAISLHLVGDEAMRQLNRGQRGLDATTDVLSFPLRDPSGLRFVLPPDQPIHLGDVVISHPRAFEQAKASGHSPERELSYLAAHGVLHLLGYDHQLEADRTAMRDQEERALAAIGAFR